MMLIVVSTFSLSQLISTSDRGMVFLRWMRLVGVCEDEFGLNIACIVLSSSLATQYYD